MPSLPFQIENQSLFLTVSPEIGNVSAELIAPENPICVLTLAHGAGAGMHHEFMVALANALAEKDLATLRFNFPFKENNKGRPDSPAVAHKTIEAAIQKAHELFPKLPVLASGKSFGGRMSSQFLATQTDALVKGLVFFGFPLYPPGKPSIERAEHLQHVTVPMLFLQGTRDEFGSGELIGNVCAGLPLATLLPIEGANHAFKAGKRNVISELAEATRAWIDREIKP